MLESGNLFSRSWIPPEQTKDIIQINAQSASLRSLVAAEITLLAQQYCVSWEVFETLVQQCCVSWEVFETLVQRCCVIWEKCSSTIFFAPPPSPSNKAGWAYRSKLLRDNITLFLAYFILVFFKTHFCINHMYPVNPEGTQVIIGCIHPIFLCKFNRTTNHSLLFFLFPLMFHPNNTISFPF